MRRSVKRFSSTSSFSRFSQTSPLNSTFFSPLYASSSITRSFASKSNDQRGNQPQQQQAQQQNQQNNQQHNQQNQSAQKQNQSGSGQNESINLDEKIDFRRIGYIQSVGDGVVRAEGLNKVAFGEKVLFPEIGLSGFACNLNKDSVDILVLGDDRAIKAGMIVVGTSSGLRIPVSRRLLGHVINPLGEVIDGSDVQLEENCRTADVNVKAPGIIFRESVREPMFTGIKVIDSLIPIGRGQRELVIGDKGTGKTSICFDAMLNQKNENYNNSDADKLYCIYVAVGQKRASVKQILNNLKKFDALDYSVIVAATASDSAALQYLAPYAGCALGEFFMTFANSLIIYDDLSQHAMAYRQISLLLRRPPGREAYPGDVFYLHSRLLERSAKLNKKYGSGSLTALPIVETLFGDVTAYIPTNVISITDGQIFLDKNLFTEGIIPAVNIGLSVSRVGSAAQLFAMKKVAGSLKLELAQYREVKDFMKFGSDLSEDTLQLIKRGTLLTELLKQKRFAPISPEKQIMAMYAGLNGFLDNVSLKDVDKFFTKLYEFIGNSALFSLHFESLRFEQYYKAFGPSVLEVMMTYFSNYVFPTLDENQSATASK